ncbi:hypothetical protein DFJ75_4437 [Williamsia muralis]|uniref:Uncharacterized protein n=1 Tax=Williamsia marianensis TaxID=85044 RepID=A0A495K8Q6_WILMA|nr:hypothetical protein [Williamsia muralis]RKR97551.1 hypothetical protein DFJ75_4437 [Williamsia muralis]
MKAQPTALHDRGLAVAEASTAVDSATQEQVWSLYDGLSDDAIAEALGRETEINRAWTAEVSAGAQSSKAVFETDGRRTPASADPINTCGHPSAG